MSDFQPLDSQAEKYTNKTAIDRIILHGLSDIVILEHPAISEQIMSYNT